MLLKLAHALGLTNLSDAQVAQYSARHAEASLQESALEEMHFVLGDGVATAIHHGSGRRESIFSETVARWILAALPAIVALTCFQAVIAPFGAGHTLSVAPIVVVGLTCLVLIRLSRAPRLSLISLRFPEKIISGWFKVLGVLLGLGYATGSLDIYPRKEVMIWALVTPVVMILATWVLNRVLNELGPRVSARSVLFAGYTESGVAFARVAKERSNGSWRVEGFFDDRDTSRLQPVEGARILGRFRDMARYVTQRKIDIVCITLPMLNAARIAQLIQELRETSAAIYFVPDKFGLDLIRAAHLVEVDGLPVVSVYDTPLYGFNVGLKRVMDFVLAGILLLFLAPMMLAIAVGIKLTSPGPVLFRQRRYGLNGREIIVYKFRTMTVVEDSFALAQASRADNRITPLGRFLRKTSLDELPQILSVLEGTMSLVGPRPHAVAHNEQYRKLIDGYAARHSLLPGITGLAQVNGSRGETGTIEQMIERVRYDREYLRNWSLLLDFEILFRTIIVLFSARDTRDA